MVMPTIYHEMVIDASTLLQPASPAPEEVGQGQKVTNQLVAN